MTKEAKNASTKQKILKVANDLFAKKGFAGASIREIASGADVNIAAINYHFQNKENLYWKVFESNYEMINEGVSKSGNITKTTEDLAIEVFRFFMSSESAMMNTFKIFISDNVGLPPQNFEQEEEQHFGPPGEAVFLEKIRSDVGEGASPLGERWVMKMIFSLLIHFGVIMNTDLMKVKCQKDDDLKPENIEKFLRHSVRAHLKYLKENSKKFEI